MKASGWLLFAVVSVALGIPYLFSAVAIDSIPPVELVFMRMVLGAAVLAPWAMRRHRLRALWNRRGTVLGVAALQGALPLILITTGQLTVPSGVTGLVVASQSLMTIAILAVTPGRRRVTLAQTLGVLVALAGMVLISGGLAGGPAASAGLAAIVVAVLCYALAAIVIERRAVGLPATDLVGVGCALNAIALGIGLGLHGSVPAVPAGEALVAVLVLGIVCSGIGIAAISLLAAREGATIASFTVYASAVVALALGVGVRGEPVDVATAFGGALVALGCALGLVRLSLWRGTRGRARGLPTRGRRIRARGSAAP